MIVFRRSNSFRPYTQAGHVNGAYHIEKCSIAYFEVRILAFSKTGAKRRCRNGGQVQAHSISHLFLKAELDTGIRPAQSEILEQGVLVEIPVHVSVTQRQVDLGKTIVYPGQGLPGQI